MEVVKVDQSICAYKQTRGPKKISRAFSSIPSENLAPINSHGGLLSAPPPSLSYSYPPTHHHYYRQPPLLPLPVSRPHHGHSPPSRSRGLSCPPTTGKTNKARDNPIATTPKKSKSKPPCVSKIDQEETKQQLHTKSMKSGTGSLIVTSTNRLGPEPNDLPKDVSKVLWKSNCCVSIEGDLDKFSGSVFSLAPPPSSLPLPRFSVRPKLSCNAEATGIDAGATDNLCRLLRLR
ncbi:sec-independent protein translocase protein TATC, chloroplastic [Ziziphus jujuba]|uniref:Sec-independent protein translocase protein TATC, chloroplastic n=1 Tax=Ziziphus jujuba TaxID=326968 RepID=A0A6P4A9N2_ZIZJJ|nr:sec-independent protein translocase protein TATC, chloroplastic [Ziziphus jujuba]